jgi:hypothetical protein
VEGYRNTAANHDFVASYRSTAPGRLKNDRAVRKTTTGLRTAQAARSCGSGLSHGVPEVP